MSETPARPLAAPEIRLQADVGEYEGEPMQLARFILRVAPGDQDGLVFYPGEEREPIQESSRLRIIPSVPPMWIQRQNRARALCTK